MSGPRACVIGWPVGHSRSPLIHSHWLAAFGLTSSYERHPVQPDAIDAFVAELRAGSWVGCNVTIPHKGAMAARCDRLSETANRLGSVNTVWREGELLCGDTTDGIGFLGALDQELPGWESANGNALIIGAGGAAPPIVDALRNRGFKKITLASRTASRAEALAAALGCEAAPLDTLELGAVDLLVNASPAGMAGQPPLALDLSALPSHAIVDDIVYAPAVTPLLAAARAQGLRHIGGLGMLLHQAAPGFERFFGKRPAVTPELRALVEADVAAG
jgi:shikimate dehydrogenase